MLLIFELEKLSSHLFGKKLFSRFTVRAFHDSLSLCLCVLSLLVLGEGCRI